jgi:hypothetical protein
MLKFLQTQTHSDIFMIQFYHTKEVLRVEIYFIFT